jgi:transcriptional regulator with XRE-family HTH domain
MSDEVETERQEALKLADELVRLSAGNMRMQMTAMRLRDRVKQTPIAEILNRMTESTTPQRAERLGVSRQAIYSWLSGRTRPNKKAAKKIAKVTGVAEAEIRGK